jgi:hypothetical protein
MSAFAATYYVTHEHANGETERTFTEWDAATRAFSYLCQVADEKGITRVVIGNDTISEDIEVWTEGDTVLHWSDRLGWVSVSE